MSRTFRQARRALPAMSLATLAFIGASSSASATGACPGTDVETTVNIDGSLVPGCRATFTYIGTTEWFTAPRGGGRARVLLIGGGGGGGNRNLTWTAATPTPNTGGGGGGGAGGEISNTMVTLETCASYEVGVGYGGAAAVSNAYANGVGYSAGNGGLSHISRGSWRVDALGGGGSVFTYPPNFMPGGSTIGASGALGGGAGDTYGGGGGGVGPGGISGGQGSTNANGGTGGRGGEGQDISASFPGLAATLVGGGGGGFGSGAGGAATYGGGAGGKTGLNAVNGVNGAGGGGGGGAQTGPSGSVVYYQAGRGGDGTVVIDYPVPASTSCSGGGGGGTGGGGSSSGGTSAGGSSSTGSSSGGASTTATTTLNATMPRASSGVITTSVTAPGPGTAVLTGAPIMAPEAVTCTATRSFTFAGTATMTCVPGAGVQRLRRVKPVRVKLTVTFKPTSGAAQTMSVGTVRLSKVRARPIAVTG